MINFENTLAAWPYWLVFSLPAIEGVVARQGYKIRGRSLWIAYAAVLVLFVGLRAEVGADWGNYQSILSQADGISLAAGLRILDPGYALLNWIGENTFGGIYPANFACALLAVVPLMYFCRSRSNPWLSLAIAVPYLVIVVYMGYTRQSAAIGLCLLAIMSSERERFWAAIGFVMAAALFHRSASGFLLPIVALSALPFGGHNARRALLTTIVSAAFILLLFASQGGLGTKFDTYLSEPSGEVLQSEEEQTGEVLQSEEERTGEVLQSAGALPRLGLGLLAGITFLWFTRGEPHFNARNGIWTLSTLGAFALLPLALVTSTFADRIGLYLIPLQLHAVSVADARIVDPATRLVFRLAVLGLYGAMLIVWLMLSHYARYWLPYDNLLFHFFRAP